MYKLLLLLLFQKLNVKKKRDQRETTTIGKLLYRFGQKGLKSIRIFFSWGKKNVLAFGLETKIRCVLLFCLIFFLLD